MPEAPHTKESLEHVERAHELISESGDRMLRFVPLSAAVLAILAGLCGLYSARLGEKALALRSEAVLSQTLASDAWNEYQADSLKAHLYDIGSQSTANSALLRRFAIEAKKYRNRQPSLREKALEEEKMRDAEFQQSEGAEHRHVLFDIVVALFEIAIVLTSIAAMTKQRSLFLLAGAAGIVGVIIGSYGFLP